MKKRYWFCSELLCNVSQCHYCRVFYCYWLSSAVNRRKPRRPSQHWHSFFSEPVRRQKSDQPSAPREAADSVCEVQRGSAHSEMVWVNESCAALDLSPVVQCLAQRAPGMHAHTHSHPHSHPPTPTHTFKELCWLSLQSCAAVLDRASTVKTAAKVQRRPNTASHLVHFTTVISRHQGADSGKFHDQTLTRKT